MRFAVWSRAGRFLEMVAFLLLPCGLPLQASYLAPLGSSVVASRPRLRHALPSQEFTPAFCSLGQGSLFAIRPVIKGVIDASGDENHAIYAGLNYYISGQNPKLLTGIEYETVDGGTADSESTTVWGAVRFYF